jgi:hypothetical protein
MNAFHIIRNAVLVGSALAIMPAAIAQDARPGQVQADPPATQEQAGDPGLRMGPGMMRGGGPGMMGGMGPGMMSGEGPGMMSGEGPGMMSGGGPGMMGGMGPGMMGGMGPGMMSGMMGGMGPGMMGGMGPGMTGGQCGWIADAVGINREQETRVNQICDELRKAHWDLGGKMMAESQRLRDLNNAEKRDPAAIGEQFARVQAIQRQMLEQSIRADNQIESLLTPDQRTRFQQMPRRWLGR